MNMDSGTGYGGSPYEYTVAEKKTPAVKAKKIAFIFLYIFWCAGLLLAGAGFKLILPLLALIPISTWILVFLTWRYTQIEYEYSFLSGRLTVSRIMGGRSRRTVTELTIKDLDAVLPYEDEYVDRINAYGAQVTYAAASAPDSPKAYIALWQEDGKKKMLCFEPNEKAIKLMRYYNVTAVTVRKENKA